MDVARAGDGSDGFAPTEDGQPDDAAGPPTPVGAPSLQGIARLLPPIRDAGAAVAFKKAQAEAEDGLVRQLRAGAASHASCARSIIDKLLKRGAREAVFDWFGRLLHANRRRTQLSYDQVCSVRRVNRMMWQKINRHSPR